MRARLVVVLLAIALIASACFWDESGNGARSTTSEAAPKATPVDHAAPLHTQWSALLANPTSAITQASTGLIVITGGTTLTALNPVTGALVWSHTEPSGVSLSGATAYGNDIVVTTIQPATQTTNLEILDARTGATTSTTPIAPTGGPKAPGRPGMAGVTKSGPWVVTTWGGTRPASDSPHVFGLGGFQVTNLDAPSLSWRFSGSIGAGDSTFVDSYENPVIVGDHLYLMHNHAYDGDASIASTITAWNLSGCGKPCAPLFETSDITTAPVAPPDGQALYAATPEGFAAFDPATGTQEWVATISGTTFGRVFAADDGEVVESFVNTSEGPQAELAVYPPSCLTGTCTPTWTMWFPVDSYVSNAVIANGVIYAAVDKYNRSGTPATSLVAYPLHCVNSCRPLSRTPVGDQVTAGPMVSNGQVLYGTASGKVAALTP